MQKNTKALGLSTFSFSVCFAVWTIFSILGVQIKANLNLTDAQFGILVATPVLTGSLSRLLLGVWADQYGGRVVLTILMLCSAFATFMLSTVTTYNMFLIAALGVGLAGGSFAVGVAYVSQWYSSKDQGTALGIFGVGNVGAAVTNFGAPFILIAYGWEKTAQVYAIILAITAILFFLLSEDDPKISERKAKKEKPRSLLQQLSPLKEVQVWRFSLYYFFVFGAFVSLALWLPRYYVGVYGLDLKTAGMLAASYSLPGSIFRALGGWGSDKYGARAVMYVTFIACALCTLILSYPNTTYIIKGIDGDIEFSFQVGLGLFVVLTFLLGLFMSLGKAAVYKHIPTYYPNHVGAVGGVVGLIGGLGGFFLPILFGYLNDTLKVWTSSFMVLFAIVMVSLIWMNIAISHIEKEKNKLIKANK